MPFRNVAPVILIFLIITILSSCQKDKVIDPNIDSNLFGKAEIITITGQVLNNAGSPISGATVSSGSNAVTTDIFGVFTIEDADVSEKLGFVKVKKAGFFDGYRSFVPSKNNQFVIIQLVQEKKSGEFKTAEGSMISSQGVKINFPAGNYLRNNSVYEGDVNVSIHYYSPIEETFLIEMPGGLISSENNNIRGLTSYGMVTFNLTDDAGEIIELGGDQAVEITFPIPTNLQSIAPSQIPLWTFDKDIGIWMPEGSAELKNGNYVAEVFESSEFFNLDIPWEPIQVEVIINLGAPELFTNSNLHDRNNTNYPAQSAKVIFKSASGVQISGYTNTNGNYNDIIPLNEKLQLIVQANCGSAGLTEIYNVQVGPFTSAMNTAKIEIEIDKPEGATIITGTVADCNDTPLSNGYILANGILYMLDKGRFSFMDCGTSVNIRPFSLPIWTTSNNQSFDLTGDSLNVGSIRLCPNADSTSVTDIDGNNYRIVKIGNQIWMAENLRTTHFNNGEEILNIISNTDWKSTTNPAWSNYMNDIAFDTIYGKYYNGYVISENKNVCPVGWHVPTLAECDILEFFLGEGVAGSKMKSIGNVQDGNGLWFSNPDATNESGWTGHPGGNRHHSGVFVEHTYFGSFFCVEPGNTELKFFSLAGGSPRIAIGLGNSFINSGYCIRCIKD